LEQWLETAPAVDEWLAGLLGKLPAGVRDLASYWESLAATSNPPFSPMTFLAGRSGAAEDFLRACAFPPGTALFHGHTLPTHNKRHFEPAGVQIVDPLD